MFKKKKKTHSLKEKEGLKKRANVEEIDSIIQIEDDDLDDVAGGLSILESMDAWNSEEGWKAHSAL